MLYDDDQRNGASTGACRRNLPARDRHLPAADGRQAETAVLGGVLFAAWPEETQVDQAQCGREHAVPQRRARVDLHAVEVGVGDEAAIGGAPAVDAHLRDAEEEVGAESPRIVAP